MEDGEGKFFKISLFNTFLMLSLQLCFFDNGIFNSRITINLGAVLLKKGIEPGFTNTYSPQFNTCVRRPSVLYGNQSINQSLIFNECAPIT